MGSHVRFANAFCVDDSAAVRHEDRAIEVAKLLIPGNDLVNALGRVEPRRLTRQLSWREKGEQCYQKRELAEHAGEDTSPAGENQCGESTRSSVARSTSNKAHRMLPIYRSGQWCRSRLSF